MMRLADCSSERYCFELDPRTGAYSRRKLPTPRSERRGYSGMGQLLRSPREGKVLFAEYVLDGEAWFSIGAERWKRFDRAIRRTTISISLWPICRLIWFHTICHRSRRQRSDFIEMWTDDSGSTGRRSP